MVLRCSELALGTHWTQRDVGTSLRGICETKLLHSQVMPLKRHGEVIVRSCCHLMDQHGTFVVHTQVQKSQQCLHLSSIKRPMIP